MAALTNIEKAFLDTIAYVEGTLGVSKNGYDVAVGFNRIVGWTENTSINHGHQKWLNKSQNSTAAGRYQFTYDTWIDCNGKVNKPMTKTNQDQAAIFLLKLRMPDGLQLSGITEKVKFSQLIGELKKNTWTGFKSKTLDDAFGIFQEALSKY